MEFVGEEENDEAVAVVATSGDVGNADGAGGFFCVDELLEGFAFIIREFAMVGDAVFCNFGGATAAAASALTGAFLVLLFVFPCAVGINGDC